MTEALRLWKFDNGGKGPGYKPNIVNLASEQGLTPTPGYLMYGVSKAGIIAATQTVAASQPGLLRANVVAPGLVDTPLTWNQARGLVLQNGTLKPSPLGPVQFGFQCINKDGTKVIEQGDCPGTGGTGYTCPCPDVRRDDPRLKPMFAPLGILPVDPRLVAASVLAQSISRLGAVKTGGAPSNVSGGSRSGVGYPVGDVRKKI